jgi:outer membrane protein assembly factor BamC
MRFILYSIPALFLFTSIGGCSSSGGFFTDSERAYRTQETTVEDLEVPPDLTSSTIQDAMVVPGVGGTSYEEYSKREKSTPNTTQSNTDVLPEFDNIAVQRDGNTRWLVIQGAPQQIWPKIVDFWRKNGLLLIEQNPAIGVMKTDWLESRADIKQGVITEFFRKALGSVYSSATRDQFRVRLEPGRRAGTTELFLTHRGMEEKLVENVSGQADTTYWTPRPSDPEIEAAMLRSLMVHLGVSKEQSKALLAQEQEAQPRSRLVKTPQLSELYILESFPRAWRLIGISLDRVGFAVEDRDRSVGVYYVRYNRLDSNQPKKEGFFSKLAFWRDDEIEIDDKVQYQVELDEMDGETRVVVRNESGERDNSETAQRILTLISEQIR